MIQKLLKKKKVKFIKFTFFLIYKDSICTKKVCFCKQKHKLFEFDLKETEIKSALFNDVPEDMFMVMDWV
jgi:hypothetical protein